MKPETITMFLMDGKPTQRIKCTSDRWSGGLIYKIPRRMLGDCKEEKCTWEIAKHLKQSGIYFLLGKDADTEQGTVYIGQAICRKNGEGLLGRILEHNRNEKENYWGDWTEAICLTTREDTFGPTDISYLESEFTKSARKANRYKVWNGNDPNPGNVAEEKIGGLQEHMEYTEMILGVLGHNIFATVTDEVKESVKSKENNPTFEFKGKLKASGTRTDEGFVVLKGSEISPTLKKSASEAVVKARKKYADIIDAQYRLTADALFSSPSAAAGFVSGCSLSGNVSWITKDGKTPKDF